MRRAVCRDSGQCCTRLHYLKLEKLPLRQTLDDDESDVCVGGDTSFHALDVILC